MGAVPVAHLSQGRLCGQSRRGACRSEGLVSGEHLPDRLGQAPGDVDLGDLGAALFAQPGLVALVAVAVERMPSRRAGRLRSAPSAGTSGPCVSGRDGRCRRIVDAGTGRCSRTASSVSEALCPRSLRRSWSRAPTRSPARSSAAARSRARPLTLSSRSMAAISRSRSSIIATAASTPSARARGTPGARAARGPAAEQIADRAGCPKANSWAWTRCFSAERSRTKNSRQRARSRSARTSFSSSQIAGTRSRRESSASTHASMRSVLHANGASPLTLCASTTSTSQPSRSSVSCTNRAPFIDSIAARTATGPWRNCVKRANPRRPSTVRRRRADLDPIGGAHRAGNSPAAYD